MPRRNNRGRSRWPKRPEVQPAAPAAATSSRDIDTDALARRLVREGKASVVVLGHSVRPFAPDLTRGEGVPRDTGTAVDPPLDNFLPLLASFRRDVTLSAQRDAKGVRRG